MTRKNFSLAARTAAFAISLQAIGALVLHQAIRFA
jgi:hypothetical protein